MGKSNFLDVKSKTGGCVRYLRSHKEKVEAENAAKSTVPEEAKTNGPLFVAGHAGVGYCRTAIVDSKGKVIKIAVAPVKVYEHGIFSEMSSENIWTLMVKLIRVSRMFNLVT